MSLLVRLHSNEMKQQQIVPQKVIEIPLLKEGVSVCAMLQGMLNSKNNKKQQKKKQTLS